MKVIEQTSVTRFIIAFPGTKSTLLTVGVSAGSGFTRERLNRVELALTLCAARGEKARRGSSGSGLTTRAPGFLGLS